MSDRLKLPTLGLFIGGRSAAVQCAERHQHPQAFQSDAPFRNATVWTASGRVRFRDVLGEVISQLLAASDSPYVHDSARFRGLLPHVADCLAAPIVTVEDAVDVRMPLVKLGAVGHLNDGDAALYVLLPFLRSAESLERVEQIAELLGQRPLCVSEGERDQAGIVNVFDVVSGADLRLLPPDAAAERAAPLIASTRGDDQLAGVLVLVDVGMLAAG